MPAFVGEGPVLQAFGNLGYLWGNTPAFDVLNIDQNEGQDHNAGFDLCFAGRLDMSCYTAREQSSNAFGTEALRILLMFVHQHLAISATSCAPSTAYQISTRAHVPLFSTTRIIMS